MANIANIAIIVNDSSTPVELSGTIPPKRFRIARVKIPAEGPGSSEAPKRVSPCQAPYDARLVLENVKFIRREILERNPGAATERCDVMIDHLENVLAES